jgi:hypothetical protein
MNYSERALSEERRQHIETILTRRLEQLFQRLPMLSGFWLRPDLKVAELTVFTWPGFTAGDALREEVIRSLIELAEEHHEAVQLMRGRTFARALH